MKKPIKFWDLFWVPIKVDLKMKLTSLFLFLALLNINAHSSYSQSTKITLDMNQVSVQEVLDKIESLSDFKFFINTRNIDTERIVSIKGKKERIKKILNKLFNETDIAYEVYNKQIILKTKQSTAPPIANIILPNLQSQVKGVVLDEYNTPVPGVNVVIVGTQKGTQTDFDGNYTIAAKKGDVLQFSYIGYKTKTITVGDNATINITLAEDIAELDDVVIVGFGSQKKESIVGSIASVRPSEIKIPSSNLTTALAGRVSGVVSYQTSGAPGANNADFFVRGVASFNNQNGPLILIDGVELTVDDLARLQPDDIESFSVLKDPTTTAIYGARGANGIILVTTKTGVSGKPVVNLRIENSFTHPVSLIELADPVTYMTLQNEAGRTRGGFPTYTEAQLAGLRRGGNPNVYPAVNWYDELFQDYTTTQRVNLNVRGGGDKVRYYVSGAYTNDNGILKVDPVNDFNNNISFKTYLLRSNINVDLHENTEMIVRLHSTIEDYNGPLQDANTVYAAAVRTSPVRFPVVFDPDPANVSVPYLLFGNSTSGRALTGSNPFTRSENPVWFNPYAELQRGFSERRRSLNLVQLELKQKLDAILPGLKARFLGNFNTTSQFGNSRGYAPFYYEIGSVDPANDDNYTLNLIGGGGDETLGLEPSSRINNSTYYMEAALNYDRVFNEKHSVSGLLVMIAREFLDGNASSVQLSLPGRNVGVSGRFNYGYDDRYFVEANFGYNGSERFAKNNRFGFFPSFGVGWAVSNEPFYPENALINKLKLRLSYGFVGNDRIGNTRADRFFYLSEVNLNGGGGYLFGDTFQNFIGGVSINRYANPQVTWELAEKANIGLDINLFNDAVQLRVDAFGEKRTNILQVRQDIPTTLGLQTTLSTNVGEVEAYGIDASIDINHSFSPDFWVTGRGTFTYADNEFKVFEEPNYSSLNAPWRSFIGRNVSQSFGYIAERLFIDDEEAINSPRQLDGVPGVDYGGGDIKYKDLNGDGQITELDRTGIGLPTVPKITYGFGFSMGYKAFDLSAFFQGLGQTSFLINSADVAPFTNTVTGPGGLRVGNATATNGFLGENGLIKAFADDHWSEDNRNPFALWPRLSENRVVNNEVASTFWLRDGSFLRLKQVEIGFDMLKALKKSDLSLARFRIYLSGTNLIAWSKFKLWDPELRNSGLNYPLQRTANLGIQLGF